ncbi:MAG: DUF4298 domain-containing protein [Bacteroidales bacterium]|nr:DUF4298 domain-containing protein [Bacteroidales bacterium]
MKSVNKSKKCGAAARVAAMSAAYRKLSGIMESLERDLEALEGAGEELAALREYQASGKWLKDFEADEAKRIPEGTDRAVLSEDGLYNLLSNIDALPSRLSGTLSGKE